MRKRNSEANSKQDSLARSTPGGSRAIILTLTWQNFPVIYLIMLHTQLRTGTRATN